MLINHRPGMRMALFEWRSAIYGFRPRRLKESFVLSTTHDDPEATIKENEKLKIWSTTLSIRSRILLFCMKAGSLLEASPPDFNIFCWARTNKSLVRAWVTFALTHTAEAVTSKQYEKMGQNVIKNKCDGFNNSTSGEGRLKKVKSFKIHNSIFVLFVGACEDVTSSLMGVFWSRMNSFGFEKNERDVGWSRSCFG